ncbi:integrase [Sphingopyxis sp. H038]|nr:Phage integrase [Sphingopyxis sp. LC363]KTE00488.1 integrase [Sphingopyxis sp. H012]KTE08345.1 integrase [Sphingopyxis sp. H053]KTE13091.1 integrase [Sphingopyxis sp. H093]KTE23788.1 integrase [Sphingopyxis sp. H057]KTE26943.1 integrase [Sphingopyxis sp. H080]KTE33114.1 integrase [Sphingopyxis sp. H038]KTE41289.1 integrase [Sphingopyxis sp. H005]KTE43079.1 integrase [Sphingopyxis sp. H077]KTE50256.1 integrase [Sphingopyxis sp. H073]KTE50642.1 integrase [Sphingopyxis sp. H071]KTE59931.
MASGKITKRSVDALISSGQHDILWDDSIKGFGAKRTKAGAVSYVLQFRMGGRESKTRRYTIGSHGSPWTPATARAEAERLAILIAQGIDPGEAERQRRRESVDLAFDNYSDRFAEACVGEGWRRLVKRSLELHVKPVLGSKPLPNLTRIDIVAVFDRMPRAQIANIRNVFAVLRRLLRWAVSRGDIDRSPMEGMETPPPVKPRDRWLSDEELGRIWMAAPNTHSCFGPIIRLLIVTGQRREEVSSLRWEELNRKDLLWTLPGERAKNGEPNRIPLNELAVAILDEVAGSAIWPRSGRMFTTSRGGRFTGYSKGKIKLDLLMSQDGREPLPDWRLHDLRRTLATGFQRLGVRFEVTEAVLNHVGGSRAGVAGIYQRHDWKDEKREAMKSWNDHLAAIIRLANMARDRAW